MRKLLLIAALAAFAYIALFAQQALGQELGCCCEPINHLGEFNDNATCTSLGRQFTENVPDPALGETCNDICQSTFGGGVIITPPSAGCDSPTYKVPPGNVLVKAVKGKKQLKITYTLPCPLQTNAINISRCKGDDCEDFVQVAQMSPTGSYTDSDPQLLWNTDYTYQIISTSRISGPSDPAIANGNPGDIECWNQGYEKFCIANFYYDRFESYLSEHGYLATEFADFANDFTSAVASTFSGRFNKGGYCNDVNLLGQTGTNCPEGQVCVAGASGTACMTPSPCGQSGLFGLYSSSELCEGTGTSKKYCFFDRSQGSVDKCYSCSPRMACADYRSKGACDRNNCNAGNCSWRNVFTDIGIGVCVDSRFPNCVWCNKTGTPGLENAEAYNEVFDQCTNKKSAALTTTKFLCIFDRNAQNSNDCDATACMDYNDTACGSPPAGIKLNPPDNSVVSPSTDPCNIRVCQLVTGIGCVKNADGNGFLDCALKANDRRTCELDHFAPNTTFVTTSYQPTRFDWLAAKMLDKFNATHDGEYMEGKPGYTLHVCVVSASTPCTDASTFAVTNNSLLNFNDLYLQAGKDVLTTMQVGENTLKYYGVDNRNNPEVVKEIKVLACNMCQGPKVIYINVTPSRMYEGKFYTMADIPVVSVSFNELATITSASLSIGDKMMPVNVNPISGANYDYTFIPLNPLDDGEYVLSFNAKDNNGLPMDFQGSVVFVVDTTPGNVQIIPPDGTVINETTVDISFIFEEQPNLLSATLENEIWISKYAAKKRIINLLPLLTTEDQLTYMTTLKDMYGGKKNLKVQAEDLAGNPIIGKSSFWINRGPLQMRMRQPAWGVSSQYTFDIVIDTSIVSQCKYAYDLPSPVPIAAFDEILPAFPEESDVVHKIPGFSRIPVGDLSAHNLYVYCKAGNNISIEKFELRVDTTPPTIKSAYADPAVIIERRVPNKDIFTTQIKVQTDDEGFCKYSTENVPFVLMNGLFSDFDEVPKRSHNVEINVTQDNASYTYYVACKNLAQIPSPTVPVKFSVDTKRAFAAVSMTPPYSNTTNVTLRVETNKRAFCYVGETPDTILTMMGTASFGYGNAHTHPAGVNSSGNYTWYVKCSTGAGNEVATLAINVVVDITPPYMLYVNDNSSLPDNPEVSYFLNQLMVSFLGFDNETAVNAYYYRLTTFFANTSVVNWTRSTETNGTAFYVTGLNLTDGNKYLFEVYPVNIVGLQGGPMRSNGVTIDSTKRPAHCDDNITNGNETDVDCGGACPGCFDGAKCAANTDCQSGFCSNGVCAIASCEDSAKNGKETDVDCGGGDCLPCGMNMSCVENTDCASNSCNFGKCGETDPCMDGQLTGTESDIDCGGSCPTKCGQGKNCQIPPDCADGLMCVEGTCLGQEISENVSYELPPEGLAAPAAPPSKTSMLLWLIILLLILAVLGVGGWLGYQYYLEKQMEKIPPSVPSRGMPAPEKKYRKWPAIIEKLRKIARKEEPGVIDRDWMSLAELSERLKKEKVHVHKDVFDRLEDLLRGKIPKSETESIIEAVQKEPKAFKLLRRISFEKLTQSEKEFVRKRLAFLKSGKLTSAELEEILTKLRITAAYYKSHREELERELEEWLGERRKHK
jgi:hypothetical protein